MLALRSALRQGIKRTAASATSATASASASASARRSLSTQVQGDYTIVDHEFDAIVVGAGGAGLIAARGGPINGLAGIAVYFGTITRSITWMTPLLAGMSAC